MILDWTHIDADTLNAVSLDTLVRHAQRPDCTTLASVLSRSEREDDRWTPAERECLRFAVAVLTMTLRPDQPAEPYGPTFVFDGQRSAIPADFDKEGLLGLQPWALSLGEPELRARFLDLLWIQARSFRAATEAVDAYLASALKLEPLQEWSLVLKRLERGVRLAASLGRGGTDLRSRMLVAIEAMLHRHRDGSSLNIIIRLTRLLLEFKHGDANHYSKYALAAANAAEGACDFWNAKDCYQLAAECKWAVGDKNGEAEARTLSAECLVKEAERAHREPARGAMAAASILSDAIAAMRQLPDGRGSTRAAELHEKLLYMQKESVAELKTISTTTNATELVQRARIAVRGKSLRDAVLALCAMAQPPSMAMLMEEVHEQARVAVFGSMIAHQVLNGRGKVVATAPGLDGEARDPAQEGLRWRMFRQARALRAFTALAALNPARLEIDGTHGPDRRDIAGLIQYSPWIPPGHAESITRALLAGFQGDMIVAAHLVPPQFEAMVRHIVESQGGTTSNLKTDGVQPERSLGPLLETPEVLNAFGADGVFELQDVLSEPLGRNLRNEIAHGLLDDSDLFETDVLYAWWLLLRCCVLSSKHVASQRPDSGAESGHSPAPVWTT